MRDWTYVLDNVAAQWLVLTEGDAGRGLQRRGRQRAAPTVELTRRLLDRLGAGRGQDRAVADRPGHDRATRSTPTKVRASAGDPAHTFDEALDATVAWYRANEDWWRPLKTAGASQRRGDADATLRCASCVTGAGGQLARDVVTRLRRTTRSWR